MPRGQEFGRFAVAVEEAGFDVLTIPDHLVASVSPFVGAAAAAAATSRLHTGTLVLNNDLRHPVETAREAATVADISGGRFELGLGAGHMQSEYDAAGLRFDSGGTRVDRLIEAVDVIRPLLDGEPVDVDDAHYCVRDAAGDRFEAIGLNALIQAVRHTDDRAAAAAELAETFHVTPEYLLESPFVLLGTHEQMAKTLVACQQRFGVSYWTVFDEWAGRPSAMADIAKVIALLRS